MENQPKKQRRGFSAMSPEKQRSIAALGGKASHAKGTGHKWNSADAKAAGKLGGKAARGGRGKLVVAAVIESVPTPVEKP